MSRLIEKHQPAKYRQPLGYKSFGKKLKPVVARVLYCDPTIYYARILDELDPFSRYQSISVGRIFPKAEGVCACGCERPLPEGKRKWYSDDCSDFAFYVRSIICGDAQIIRRFIGFYYGHTCAVDGCTEVEFHLDHKLAIVNGGGRMWLSGYQFLCETHHKIKTRFDLNTGSQRRSGQQELFDPDEVLKIYPEYKSILDL